MSSGDKKRRLTSKRVNWSLLISTMIAIALLVFLEFSDNGCRIFVGGHAPAIIFSGSLWLYLSALFLLPWWGRILLLLLLLGLAVAILTTNIDGSWVAATQAGAVGRVRTMQQILEAYKEKHP